MNATNDNKAKYSDVISNEFPRLIEKLDKRFDFAEWGFKLMHSGVFPQYLPYIIYQSNQCKIRFRWEQDRPYESPKIYATYGRLHAPDDQYLMSWNGQECYCWHEVGKMLNFLDGLSPVDIDNREFMVPRVIKSFYEKNKSKALSQQPEYIMEMHAHIWEKYGEHLFQLLDLSHPDLWEGYRNFLKEYYTNQDEQNKLKGIPPSPIKPPLYEVC